MLSKKSLTELRGIAQSFGVKNIFQKDIKQIIQAIELKQQEITPDAKVDMPLPAYDARLMTKPPARKSDGSQLMELLQPYIDRGLKVEITDEQWKFSFGKKNDQGTLRMPMRNVLICADQVLA